jgi:hypothetical protein
MVVPPFACQGIRVPRLWDNDGLGPMFRPSLRHDAACWRATMRTIGANEKRSEKNPLR